MSGLASMLLDCGAIVSGSEPKPNKQTYNLVRRGVKISQTQGGMLLSRDIDLVVRTAAVSMFLAVTTEAGTPAPLGSVIVPAMLPVWP